MATNLGNKVVTRQTSWLDLAERAWGSEFHAPDHALYTFSNGSKWDSTDKYLTGIYGVPGDNSVILDGERYPDLRDGVNRDFGPGMPNGSLNQPFGSFDELVPDTTFVPTGFAAPIAEYDPYFSSVALLFHGNSFLDAGPLAVPVTDGSGQVLISNVPPAFLGNQLAFYQPGVGSNKHMLNTGAGWTGVAQAAREPFTFEFSLYCTAFPAGNANIFGAQVTNKFVYLDLTGRVSVGSWGALVLNNFAQLVLNTWTQLAITYDGSNAVDSFRGFKDGVLIATSGGASGSTVADNFSFLELPGADGATGPVFRGARKELRYTKGIQRYGANYTVRTTPFPNTGPPP